LLATPTILHDPQNAKSADTSAFRNGPAWIQTSLLIADSEALW